MKQEFIQILPKNTFDPKILQNLNDLAELEDRLFIRGYKVRKKNDSISTATTVKGVVN